MRPASGLIWRELHRENPDAQADPRVPEEAQAGNTRSMKSITSAITSSPLVSLNTS